MSLPLAQPRRAQTSAVTAPAAEKAEATTSTSFATASSAKDDPEPETMSRLPYPNYPHGMDSANLTHNPSQRRSSYPEAEHSQAYPPHYAYMLQPGPVPFTSASSLQPYANQAANLQPVLESSEAGARAARTHFEQAAAAASLNATNALKEQITADVQDAVKALGKRLEDRMDRRDKADDERHTAQLQVLSQVLTALKDLDKRVGRSGDERSVMTRLTAIEFTAGDAWEGRKDPQADDGESADGEEAQAPIATPTIPQSLSSKGSRQPSATPSKEREGSLVHAPENETAPLPDIEVNSPTPTENLPPPPASIVTTGLLAQTEDLFTRSPFDATSSGVQTPAFSDAMELEYPPESSVASAVEPLHQPQQPPQSHQPIEQPPKSTPCTEEDRRLSRVDWSQENQDLGASQHAAIFKPDNSPQAIKASSSYSPRPPMDGSVASLRLETLGDASFMGDEAVGSSTPVKTKVIPVVAPPAVSPLPSPATSPSVSPNLRAGRRLAGSAGRKEEEEEEEAGGVDSDSSVPAIEVFVEEHERDSEDEDVEMEEEGSAVPGAEMDSLDQSMEVEVPEHSLEDDEAKDQSAVWEEVEATKNDSSNAEESRSIQLDEEPARTRARSQSPMHQTGEEASGTPLLSTTVSREPVVEPSSVTQLEENKEEHPNEGGDHSEEEREEERGIGQVGFDVADHEHDVEPASGAREEEPLDREVQDQNQERERELSEEPLFLEGDPSDTEDQDSTTTHHQEDTTVKTEPEPEPAIGNGGQLNGFDPLPDSDLGITSDFDEEEYASAVWMSMQLPSSSPVKAAQGGAESPSSGPRASKSVTPRRSTSVLSRPSPSKGSSQRRPSSSSHSAVREEAEELEEGGKEVNGEVEMETIENDDEHVGQESESPIRSFSTLQPTFKTSPIQQSTPARDKGNPARASTIQPLFEGTDIDADSLPPPPSSSPFCYPDSPGKGKSQEEHVAARSPSLDNVSLGSAAYMPPPAAENVAMDQDTLVDDLTIMPTVEEDDVDGGLEYVDEPEPEPPIAAPTSRVPIIPDDDDDEPPLPKPRQKYISPSVSESEVEAEQEKVDKAASPRTPARPPSAQSQSVSASTRMSQRNRRSPSKADMYLRPSSLSASAGRGDRSPNHPVSRTVIGTPNRTGSPLKSINLSTKLKKPTPRKGPPPASTEDVIEISSGSSPELSPRVLLQQKITKQKQKMEMKKEKEQQQKTARKVSSSSSASGGKGNADTSAEAEADVIDLTMSNAEEEHRQSSDSEPAFDFDSDDSTEIIRGAPRKAAAGAGAASKPPGSQAKAPAAAPVQQKRLADRLLKPGQSAAATRIKRKQRPVVDGDNDDRPLKRAKSVIGAAVPVTKSKLLGGGRHASSASSNNSKGKGKDWSEKGGDSSDGSMIVVKRDKVVKAARTSTGGDSSSSSSSKTPSNRSTSSVLLDEDGARKLRHRTVDSKNNEVKWPTFNKHGSRKFQREVSNTCVLMLVAV
ncbi:hypothetical protein H1R20_g11721, partial [Candolleomyces eurysporus]